MFTNGILLFGAGEIFPPHSFSRVKYPIKSRDGSFINTTSDFNNHIEQRAKNILERKNPALLQPPQDLLEIIQGMESKS